MPIDLFLRILGRELQTWKPSPLRLTMTPSSSIWRSFALSGSHSGSCLLTSSYLHWRWAFGFFWESNHQFSTKNQWNNSYELIIKHYHRNIQDVAMATSFIISNTKPINWKWLNKENCRRWRHKNVGRIFVLCTFGKRKFYILSPRFPFLRIAGTKQLITVTIPGAW